MQLGIVHVLRVWQRHVNIFRVVNYYHYGQCYLLHTRSGRCSSKINGAVGATSTTTASTSTPITAASTARTDPPWRCECVGMDRNCDWSRHLHTWTRSVSLTHRTTHQRRYINIKSMTRFLSKPEKSSTAHTPLCYRQDRARRTDSAAATLTTTELTFFTNNHRNTITPPLQDHPTARWNNWLENYLLSSYLNEITGPSTFIIVHLTASHEV